jgi:uncharacterized RDD family membrane protein YckC
MPTEQSAPALSSAEEPLRYASFGPRFGSLFLDGLISLPVALLLMLGTSRFIVTGGFVLIFLFEMFYDVYLVRRFGGTPGKLIMGLKILKTNGTPITYREALLRASPDLIFSFLGSLGFLVAFSHITAAEYAALPTADHFPRLSALLPTWCSWIGIVQRIWNWGELIVLLTNRKRRAMHDFIAGTVVVVVRNPLGSSVPRSTLLPSNGV